MKEKKRNVYVADVVSMIENGIRTTKAEIALALRCSKATAANRVKEAVHLGIPVTWDQGGYFIPTPEEASTAEGSDRVYAYRAQQLNMAERIAYQFRALEPLMMVARKTNFKKLNKAERAELKAEALFDRVYVQLFLPGA